MSDEYPLDNDVFAEPWWGEAVCRGVDPDLFFPERGASTREAKAVCARCPVQAECLEFALDTFVKFGIWGGMSERERRIMRKQRHHERNP